MDVDKKRDGKVTISRGLAELTVQALLSAPAANVYLLIRQWDDAVPGLLVPVGSEPAQQA